MASAADGVLSFLIQKIDHTISRELSLLGGLNNEVDGLKSEFEIIRAVLREVDEKAEINEQLCAWTKQVRELAYDIEDALDMFAFHTSQQSRLYPGFLQWRRRSIATLVQDIKTKLHSMQKMRERYQIISSSQASSSGHQNDVHLHPRVASLYADEVDIVGIEEQRNELIAWVEKGEHKRKVMFVVGMAGLGKTLVANKVYEGTKKGFNCCAWTTLSKSQNKEELLRTILKRLFESMQKPIPEELDTISVIQLMDKLRSFLEDKRYMIFFDDLWTVDAWESIKLALPNQKHARIIITTRRSDIAYFCSGDSIGVYHLRPLPSETAQKLFHKKIFPQTGCCPSGLREWSQKFLKQCEGLPLGIVAIGKLLSNTETTTDAWRKVHDSLGSELDSNGRLSSIMGIMSVSYDDLPHYLKYCLLYFSIFPEDYSVKRSKLIRLWICEGLVKEVRGKTLEEVGEDYLKELVQRNLLLVNEVDFDRRAKSCRAHPLLHKIIFNKSQEENFCTVSTGTSVPLNPKVRRLSIQQGSADALQKSFPHCRSLFMFGVKILPHSTIEDILSSFSILKVLDLEGAPLDKFPAAIVNLILLRNLSLRNTSIRNLPKSIEKLQNLEFLDLKQTFVTELPEQIINLDKLCHLLVYRYNIKNYVTLGCVQGFKAPTRIGKLVTLQKLSFVRANREDGTISELGKLTQLRKLGIIDLKEQDGELLCHSIMKMKNLRSLDVSSTEEEHFLDLNTMPEPPKFLQRLYLKGRLHKLPDWICLLHDLVRIRLKWSKLDSSPIDALQDLPNLTELQLLDAYSGKQLVFCPGKFPNLNILELENLKSLEEVIMQRGALPSLRKLIMRRCEKMKLFPKGIDKLVLLKEFYLYDMPEDFVNGLRKKGWKFRRPVQRIPYIYCYSLDSSGYWRLRDLS